MSTPSLPLNFGHLREMSDRIGLFEHAAGRVPRREHGYCVDDVARGLVVLGRERGDAREPAFLLPRYLEFVLASQAPSGLVRNRRAADGTWTTRPSVGDWWGRAVWGLGTVAAQAPDPGLRQAAMEGAVRSMHLRPPYVHSLAFAALGAAEVAAVEPGHPEALSLLAATAAAIGRPGEDPRWPWPQPRLTYANAALPEALIAAGENLPGTRHLDDGLALLEWLVGVETRESVFSVTPVGGADHGTARPAFDQQPIEAAALADACVRAAGVTGDSMWWVRAERAVGWFAGRNDGGIPMYDPLTGGGHDGLTPNGPNPNMGAESTLCALSSVQHQRRITPHLPATAGVSGA